MCGSQITPPSYPQGPGWHGVERKRSELLLSLPTGNPTPHSRAGSGQPSLFPSSSPVMNAKAAYRVTITTLGCQRHLGPSLETPPRLKGGTSGPRRRLYSAVIDVSQTSVTPSGGTQSTPMLGPGSLFMSPPFMWQSKVEEPPGLSYPVLGPGQRQALLTEASWWAFTSWGALC